MNEQSDAEIPPNSTWRDPADIIVAWVHVGSALRTVETIEHNGVLWLVPEWIEYTADGCMRPLRIISLESIWHDYTPKGAIQVVVHNSLPDDLMPPAPAVEIAKIAKVIDLPDIWFSLPTLN
ncbi:hypothetical protein [Marinivivus vitaminiproducens]|uniref:hypothetical protein n=1 Tax=Marinivivus vitaminiproducens TaxID=3035935 RepID=UPI00279BB5C4|nr:hypothetical protein P4R82_08135 [Geminicoccaceae bacterium SCSIO 64248]